MAAKNKVTLEIKMDEKLYRSLAAAAARDRCDMQQYTLQLIRRNIDYVERIHGKLDISEIPAPTPD